jgi:hypothetical protein
MDKLIVFLFFILLTSGYSACSTVQEPLRTDYASGMFEAFVTQSYGKSTIAFYQFDVAREKAKKAGENPLKIIAIEGLFAWYRTYASSLRLYHQPPTGNDQIIGEYRPLSTNYLLGIGAYESEWGKTPEQARLMREFMLGVGEVISGVFCITVSSGIFGGIGYTAAFDGSRRIYSSLNSFWALHQTELQALQEWEKNSLTPAVSK